MSTLSPTLTRPEWRKEFDYGDGEDVGRLLRWAEQNGKREKWVTDYIDTAVHEFRLRPLYGKAKFTVEIYCLWDVVVVSENKQALCEALQASGVGRESTSTTSQEK